MVKGLKCENLDIPKKAKLLYLGQQTFRLNNVRYEITQMRGKGELPARDLCQYYYPHLGIKKNDTTGYCGNP